MPTFPPWATTFRKYLPLLAGGAGLYVVVLVWYVFSPRTTDVGYAPVQPIEFSHAQHAGGLGIDCRYCHTTVENAAHAAVPASSVCSNCHARVRATSDKLGLLRRSVATGEAIRWVRVHDLPDYVFFDHSAHVRRGVGCVSCHGRVDMMDRVRQEETLSMGWCLDCHRNPEPNLRPVAFVTQMDWQSGSDQAQLGAQLRAAYQLNPSEDCSTCHR